MESGGGSPYHGMQPMGTAEPASPYHQRPVEVQERPFIVGLLLSIVTLGIYGWYWHYQTHAELSRQLGRANKEKGLWIGYIVSQVALLVLVVVFVAAFAAAAASEPGRAPFADERAAEEAFFEILISMFALFLVGIVAWIVALILFIVYVVKQYETVTAARRAYGLAEKPGAAWFFGFYFGSMVAGSLIPGAFFVGAPVAYYNLQEHYNEIHRVAAGKQQGTYHAPAPPGYAERYQQQQGFGIRPDTSGHGAPSDAPAYGGPGTPHTYYGGGGTGQHGPQRPTWGAPSTQGYRIGERAAGAPASGSNQVEQTFRCPRCHGHVTARGPAGREASIQCAQCGEGGVVRLPE